jgi:hypothetical protein
MMALPARLALREQLDHPDLRDLQDLRECPIA